MTAVLQPARPMGATGVTVPLIGYGTAPLGKPNVTRADAVRCLNIALKVLAHGAVKDRARAVRYSLGRPGVSLAIVGLETAEQIDQIVETAAAYCPLDAEEEDALIAEVRPLVEQDAEDSQKKGESTLFCLHDTTITGWKHDDEPALVAY